jgi:hypothetical protein
LKRPPRIRPWTIRIATSRKLQSKTVSGVATERRDTALKQTRLLTSILPAEKAPGLPAADPIATS